MKRRRWLYAGAAVLIFGSGLGVGRALPRPQTYRVRRVIDGDTIEVEDDSGIRTRIRLRRVNAPERGQPGYEQARAALEALLQGQRVRVVPHARDRYGRTIADIIH